MSMNEKKNEQQSQARSARATKLISRVIRYMLHYYKIPFFIVIVCILLTAIATVVGATFPQTLVDDYITPMLQNGTDDFSGLASDLFRLACIMAGGVITAFAYNRIMVNVSQGTMLHLRDDLFRRMESLPIKYFDTHAHGDIMSVYTNDVDTLRQMLSQSVPQIINSVITMAATLVTMIVLNPALTVISILTAAVMLFVTSKFSQLSGKYYVRQQIDLGAVDGFIEEMLDGQKVVKVFCHEQAAMEDFHKVNERLRNSANKANRYANLLMPVNANIGWISYALVAIVGAILGINGLAGVTIGTVVTFVGLNKSFTNPITQVSQQLNFVVNAAAGAQRVFDLMDQEPEMDEGYVELVNAKEDENGQLTESDVRTNLWAWKHPHKAEGTVTYTRQEGGVVFDDVDFGYTDEKIVLHNISLYAKPGQKIAFVGATGAGKTTITNLINRFYDIADGKIRYDGININKIKKPDLRRSLGMVLQDTHLFTGTVMDNIRYGKLDATDEECIRAAKLANADGFIRRLPDGYDTMLTGDGSNLSQGQRQLLAIARAAVADPPALILDEATSSIDTRTEKLVQAGMDALMKGRTTFVIAHRLSTVKNSDCIMVMEQGRIIERGTHDELIEKKGKYYQLYTGNFAAQG
ncbi:ABC transporter ATP-binding protein [Faecalicatena contorta]|uniref:ABC transporter ATP-binding protein n=1 Tax=Faecalicatena contorta TaxID=39482 RepID=UPI00195F6E9C|nr:ABC transporter ATP-binding protein [Faecalicatena contorta]MBM6685738.1 ABC transporter ATP-binding protein [Faecalicatena contorta]MBM6710352.1 ABC transporter ATP-binding protein [Faecalicatena contorta]